MAERKALNPMALTAEEAARMLDIPREWVEKDLDAGAPTNPDGTINLVHYAAWLSIMVREEHDSLSDGGQVR